MRIFICTTILLASAFAEPDTSQLSGASTNEIDETIARLLDEKHPTLQRLLKEHEALNMTGLDGTRRRNPAVQEIKTILCARAGESIQGFLKLAWDALLKITHPHDKIGMADCNVLKNRFLPAIEWCHMDGSDYTVYAGHGFEVSSMAGVAATAGAYIDGKGHRGCYYEVCGSIGPQEGGGIGQVVGVQTGDQNDFAGWAGGDQISVVEIGISIGATIPSGKPYWETSVDLLGSEIGVTGHVCHVWIDENFEETHQTLAKQWAAYEAEIGNKWEKGYCNGRGERKQLTSYPNFYDPSFNDMKACLEMCRGVNPTTACEYVMTNSDGVAPGCYRYGTTVTSADNSKPGAMCFVQPRMNHVEACIDDLDWHDKSGSEWNCAKYEKDGYCKNGKLTSVWSQGWGFLSSWAHFGKTAKEACCACGKPTTPTIKTCGGNAPANSHCQFPFTYKGKTYHACTSEDHTEPWCYVTGQGAAHSKWGNCDCAVSHSWVMADPSYTHWNECQNTLGAGCRGYEYEVSCSEGFKRVCPREGSLQGECDKDHLLPNEEAWRCVRDRNVCPRTGRGYCTNYDSLLLNRWDDHDYSLDECSAKCRAIDTCTGFLIGNRNTHSKTENRKRYCHLLSGTCNLARSKYALEYYAIETCHSPEGCPGEKRTCSNLTALEIKRYEGRTYSVRECHKMCAASAECANFIITTNTPGQCILLKGGCQKAFASTGDHNLYSMSTCWN